MAGIFFPARDKGMQPPKTPGGCEGKSCEPSLTVSILGKLLAIQKNETSFARRGFWAGDRYAQEKLEQVGEAFLKGYHSAFTFHELKSLGNELQSVESDLRGFAFEGAAMALTLLDVFEPNKANRLDHFLKGPGARYVYLIHVGTGWALARIPWKRFRIEKSLHGMNPLLRWLAVDGYGFHEGYFHLSRYLNNQKRPASLSPFALRVFDQGLGRSLWFVEGTNVSRIASTVENFPVSRRADLWSGLGLACAYAGGVDRSTIEALQRAGERYISHLAQGAAFAAKARDYASNPASCTELACNVLCGASAHEAAVLTDVALEDLGTCCTVPKYDLWQTRIRNMFTFAHHRGSM